MTVRRRLSVAVLPGLLAFVMSGTASGGASEFAFDATNFSAPTSITNDFWGLRVGSPGPAVYFSESDDGCEVSESEVIATTGTGFFDDPYNIDAIVVRDREWVAEECDGNYVLVEDTNDWFAQDDDGNVWYMGEDTTAWDDEADCLTTAGSWKAGDDGAEPGVVMPANSRRGVSYRQEYYEGVAEDMVKTLRLGVPVSIGLGDYAGCLQTKEYTPLERGSIEHKFYCPVSAGAPGLTLINELKGKTKRVEYVGSTRPAGVYPTELPTNEVCVE